jgi:palmitoyltransferase
MIDAEPGCVNEPDATGYRPLQWAALNNRIASATLLLERGALIEAKDNDGQTALHWACVRGALPCAELLLRKGASLRAADSKGYTPLHVAAQYGHTGMIYHFKMRWNAEVNITDLDGRTALHWASYKGYPDPVKLLVCMDADVYRADKEGCTALHWASLKGKSEAAHILVQAGGLNALTAVDAEGNTPGKLAMDNSHRALYQFLHSQQRTLLTRDSFWVQKGMAIGCVGIIVGLCILYINFVIFATPTTMDVNLAFWSFVVLASAGVGLMYMKRVSVSDPGFVTAAMLKSLRRGSSASSADREVDDRLNHSELWAGNWGQLCVTCKFVKPFGTKHCSMRDKCVARFDHYCPWMGNAIGKRNHRDFVIFLILETIAMTIAFIVAIVRFNEESPTEKLEAQLGIVVFAFFDAVTLIPVIMLTVSQIFQAAQNITTNELSNTHRYSYLRSEAGFVNPFDRGSYAANLRGFFLRPKHEPLIDSVAAGDFASRAAADDPESHDIDDSRARLLSRIV